MVHFLSLYFFLLYRCLYNALNTRIRNLLLQYEYSKRADPLQPLAAHVSSLLTWDEPKTSDITLVAGSNSFHLHKFILSARSPYFRKKLEASPGTISWKLPNSIAPQAFEIAIRYLYMGEVAPDLGLLSTNDAVEDTVLSGIDKLSRQLEIDSLWKG